MTQAQNSKPHDARNGRRAAAFGATGRERRGRASRAARLAEGTAAASKHRLPPWAPPRATHPGSRSPERPPGERAASPANDRHSSARLPPAAMATVDAVETPECSRSGTPSSLDAAAGDATATKKADEQPSDAERVDADERRTRLASLSSVAATGDGASKKKPLLLLPDAGAVVESAMERRTTTRTASLSSLDTDDGAAAGGGEKARLRLASRSLPRAAGHAVEEPPRRRRPGRRSRPVRMLQSMCRSMPVLNPKCGGRQLQPSVCRNSSPARLTPSDSLLSHLIPSSGGSGGSSRRRMTGTLFGYRDGRVTLSLQENARCQPTLVVELALPTHSMLRELGTTAGARIVLESEKRSAAAHGAVSGELAPAASMRYRDDHRHDEDDDGWVLEEAMWTMFCNGKRVGYAVRREPTEEDIAVLETLWAVSMGGGVLPGRSDVDGPDGELAYMRGCFEHTIGSRDSESLYMVGPPGGDCPEFAIFFVRL
ncbi:hypothetical protein ACP4OV_025699 [Aristida adscensionis]